MQDYLAFDLNENAQEGDNDETEIMHAITETQIKYLFEDAEENLGRLEDYLKFIESKIGCESDKYETYPNE